MNVHLALGLLFASMLAGVDGGAEVPDAVADAGTASPAMRLEISGLRSDKGHVLLALYRPGDGFSETKAAAFRTETIPSTAGRLQVEFKDLPPGRYAIALIHDENDNRKLDTGFFGMPLEGFCFSRGAMGLFGPPSFDAAAVVHPLVGGAHPLVVKY